MGKICIFTHFLDWNFRIGDNGDVIERGPLSLIESDIFDGLLSC